jgi:hypothetical protein
MNDDDDLDLRNLWCGVSASGNSAGALSDL